MDKIWIKDMDDTETICNLPLRNTIEFKRVITIMEFRHDILRTVELLSFFTQGMY